MQNQLQIPSRHHLVHHPAFAKAGVQVFVKREDEIHKAISGNKWRKLKYNLNPLLASGMEGFVTFGGPFSNHLAAAAYTGFLAESKMIGFVRGEEADLNNPTLSFARACGMQIIRLTRQEYEQKDDALFLEKWQAEFPNYFFIPEGGSNLLGVQGCMEILPETQNNFDFIACPIGTATTFSGLLLSANPQTELLGFPALKGGDYLRTHVNNFVEQAIEQGIVPPTFKAPKWRLENDFHFGGFGKVSPDLIRFMNDFYAETKIPLDPIYTAKMMFGLLEMAKSGKIKRGSTVLAIHTGGLQGIKGMNLRLKRKHLHIDYEETIDSAFPHPRA